MRQPSVEGRRHGGFYLPLPPSGAILRALSDNTPFTMTPNRTIAWYAATIFLSSALLLALEIVAGFFRQQIAGENAGRAYAHKRGFSDATIDGGLLGYAPP